MGLYFQNRNEAYCLQNPEGNISIDVFPKNSSTLPTGKIIKKKVNPEIKKGEVFKVVNNTKIKAGQTDEFTRKVSRRKITHHFVEIPIHRNK